MRQSVLLPQTFLPLQSIQLGRLVLNVQQPHADFRDTLPVDSKDIILKSDDQFQGRQDSNATRGFGSALCHLLSLTRSKETGTLYRITTDRVVTYLLNNSGSWFHQAVQDKEVRKWIQTANRRGDEVYLVTGYHTVVNAYVHETGVDSQSTTGNVALPLAEALSATGVPVPFGEFIDPSITGGHGQQQKGQKTFLATGEQVSAVQYRKVKFKWYSSRELHDRPLGPNSWKSYWTLRGDTHDVVEVDLQDDLELEDDKVVCLNDAKLAETNEGHGNTGVPGQ